MSNLTRAGCSVAIALVLGCVPLAGAAATDEAPAVVEGEDAVLQAMSQEVERAMQLWSAAPISPYYLAIETTETQGVMITGEEGALQGYSPAHARWVDVDIRIGDPRLDSTHALRSGQDSGGRGGRSVPLGDDVAVLQRSIWREIDERYIEAAERWAKVVSDKQVLVDEEPADDLAPVEPRQAFHDAAVLQVDTALWEERIRQASAVLAESPVVADGSVRLAAIASTQRFASSDGTRLRHGRSAYRVMISVDALAEDGTALKLGRYWDAHSTEGLPDGETLIAETRALAQQLADLREAPEEEPYNGPAILTGRASAVFFHEILGHRLEGHRLKRVDDAQTFRNMVGEAILPPFISVVDDPSLTQAAGQDLNGHYRYDNQGVAGQRTVLVKDGVLVGFLQSRSPVCQGETSNGHGRRQQGKDSVTRQGNLIIDATQTVSEAKLREKLIRLAQEGGLEYGLLIDEIQGGFTFTGRRIPNAFNVNAVVAWRVFVDGRPDELVRGVDLIGTPLVTFSRIVGAGTEPAVFNGSCGAESGWVPVSAVSPSLLVSQIETQRKAKGQTMPPLLPPPAGVPNETSLRESEEEVER